MNESGADSSTPPSAACTAWWSGGSAVPPTSSSAIKNLEEAYLSYSPGNGRLVLQGALFSFASRRGVEGGKGRMGVVHVQHLLRRISTEAQTMK